MSSTEHVDAFTRHKSDNGQWDVFRQTSIGQYPFAAMEFDGYHFFKRVLARCTFTKCTFKNCHFDAAHCQDATFIGCTFVTCSFDKVQCAPETTKFDDCTFKVCTDLRFIITILAPANIRCVGGTLHQIHLTSKTLGRWELSDCHLNDIQMQDCRFTDLVVTASESVESNLNGVSLIKCRFATMSFVRVFAQQPNLTDVVVDKLDVVASRIHNANVSGMQAEMASTGSDWIGLQANAATTLKLTVTGGKLQGLNFGSGTLRESQFSGPEISSCVFSGCDLSRASFKSCFITMCTFTHANLHGMLMDCERLGTGNDFSNAKTKRFRIARYSLEYLGDNHGNLSKGQKMEMDIIDNVTTLRMSFGGVWQLVHLGALVAFLAPYVIYLAQILVYNRYLVVDPQTAEKSTLIAGLWEYIRTAGRLDGETQWIYLGIFVGLLLFNILRAFLLFRTKHYELKQECTGLPAILPLDFDWRKRDDWRRGREIALWYFIFCKLNVANLVLVAIHVGYFIFSPVFLPQLVAH